LIRKLHQGNKAYWKIIAQMERQFNGQDSLKAFEAETSQLQLHERDRRKIRPTNLSPKKLGN
jgi:hypothetical protein